jgi:hypothetical protein
MILNIIPQQDATLYYIDEYDHIQRETVTPEGKTIWASYAALVVQGERGKVTKTFSCLGNIPGQQFEKYRRIFDSMWWDGVNCARKEEIRYVLPDKTLVVTQ